MLEFEPNTEGVHMDRTDFLQNYQDGLRVEEDSSLSKTVVTREANLGSRLAAKVSPCSWLNESAPFQITVTMAGGGKQVVQDTNLHFSRASVKDMHRMLESVPICKCSRTDCSRPAFGVMERPSNRNGLCETCFITDFSLHFSLPSSET